MPKAEHSTVRKTRKRQDSSKRGGANKRGMVKPATLTLAAPGVATKPKPPRKKAAKRLPPRKTFLVAVTLPEGSEEAGLHVYAVLMRGPAEALLAVRNQFGEGVQIELTGKLSGRISKTLGLRPDEIRRI